MREIQKLNATPLSKAIKSILFPYQAEETSLYLTQWIRLTLQELEAWNTPSELSQEEAANLEALTFSEDSKAIYLQLTGTQNPIFDLTELLSQIKRVQKARTEEELTEQSRTLLEMMAANAANNGADLTPSLHDPER